MVDTDVGYVAAKIFDRIQIDDRVTKDLTYCLYCYVQTPSVDNISTINPTNYKIQLNCINGSDFKQCPSCKRIYILKDIFD